MGGVTYLVALLIVYYCNAEIHQFQQFQSLSCSKKQNITIFVNEVSMEFLDHFLYHLYFLTQNEDCFNINVYLPRDGFIVHWRPNFNMNHLENNFQDNEDNDYQYLSIPGNEALSFFERVYDEELIGNDTIQQTLVYLTEGHSETETEQDQILQKLQNRIC